MFWLLAVAVALLVGGYFLFRDTMNKLQYIQVLRLYWITRDTAVLGTPVVAFGYMYQTSDPWWRGRGLQFRYKTYTFQVGILLRKGDGLLDQLGGRDLDSSAKDIREWK